MNKFSDFTLGPIQAPTPGQDVNVPLLSDAQRAGHKHPEAFCLMWYRCEACNHMERVWNSRDGVVPYATACPSCGGFHLMHVNWGQDKFNPEHKPHDGQRVWISMTRARAAQLADQMLQRMGLEHVSSDEKMRWEDHYFGDGLNPALVVNSTPYEA